MSFKIGIEIWNGVHKLFKKVFIEVLLMSEDSVYWRWKDSFEELLIEENVRERTNWRKVCESGNAED